VKAFTIEENVERPFRRGPAKVTFIVSLTTRNQLGGTFPFIDATASVEGFSIPSDPFDDAVLLPEQSVHRALHASSRALATAFRPYRKSSFKWSDDPSCSITVERRRSFYLRGLPVTALLLLLVGSALGCRATYNHVVGLVRRDLYTLSTTAAIATYCQNGAPVSLLSWDRPMPNWRFVHVELIRNGIPIKRVDGLKEYLDDRDIKRGAHYTYHFRVVDIFGRVLSEEGNRIGALAICPGEAYHSPWTVSPASGTWATAFTFAIDPPAVDGMPKSYSWGWEGSRLDAKTGGLYERVTTPMNDKSLTRRFTACDECAYSGHESNGAWVLQCHVTVDVTFTNGRTIRFWSPPVAVRDEPRTECQRDQPIVVGSKQ
jgi:hypothetical protein